MNSKVSFVNDLFKELNRNHVQYCVIKGFEKHPYYQNDIDLFLRKSDFDFFEKIVFTLRSRYKFKLAIPSKMSGTIKDASPRILFILFSNLQSHSLLRIELFPGLYYSGQVLFNSKLILSHRCFNYLHQIYTCPPDLVALITLLSFHKSLSFNNLATCSLTSKKQIDQRTYILSELSKKKVKEDKESILHLLSSNLQLIYILIRKSFYRKFFAVVLFFKLRLFYSSIVSSPVHSLTVFIQKLSWDFQRTFPQPFSFIYKTSADLHDINMVRTRLLDEGFAREIIICNSRFKLFFNLKIRDQRSKEALVIFISSTAIKHTQNNLYFAIANNFMSFVQDRC